MYRTFNILHVDMNTFFLSVETLLDPGLKGRPVAVAGAGNRGVILSASYEARHRGVRAGMATAAAVRLMPGLVIVTPHHGQYADFSSRVHAILQRYSPDCEMASIDEAYLDISTTKHLFGNPVKTARLIKKEIRDQLSLTCSVGVAENRLLAKIGSEMQKPDGLVVLSARGFTEVSKDWPCDRLPGLGPKTKKFLDEMGIRTLGELRALSLRDLESMFGRYGAYLHAASRGAGGKAVQPESEAGSIGQETTLDQDTLDRELIRSVLLTLAGQVVRRLRKEGLRARTVTLKLRFFDFKTFTVRKTLKRSVDTADEVYATSLDLLATKELKPVRLLGITLSSFTLPEDEDAQAELFPEPGLKRDRKIEELTNRLKDRFGENAIDRAATLIHRNDRKRLRDEEKETDRPE